MSDFIFKIQIEAIENRLAVAGITAEEAKGAIAYFTITDSQDEGRDLFVTLRRDAEGWKLSHTMFTTTIDEDDCRPVIGLSPLVLKAARKRGDDLDGLVVYAEWPLQTPAGEPILVNEFELPRGAEALTTAYYIDAWTPPKPEPMTARELRALAA